MSLALASTPSLLASLSLRPSKSATLATILEHVSSADAALQTEALQTQSRPAWIPKEWPKRFPEVRDSDGYIAPIEWASDWLRSIKESLTLARLDLKGFLAESLSPTFFELEVLRQRVGSARDGFAYLTALSSAASSERKAQPAPEALTALAKSVDDIYASFASVASPDETSSAYVKVSRALKQVHTLVRRAANLVLPDMNLKHGDSGWSDTAQSLEQWYWQVQQIGGAGETLSHLDNLHLMLAFNSARATKLAEPGPSVAALLNQAKSHIPPFMERMHWHISGDSFDGDTWDLTTQPHYCSLHWCNNLIGGSSSCTVVWEKPHGLLGVTTDMVPIVSKELFEFVRQTCFKGQSNEKLTGGLLTASDEAQQHLNIPFRSALQRK